MGKTTTKATKTTTKASINFANINKDALTMASTCQLAINVLAERERELKRVRDLYKGESKEYIRTMTTSERNAVKTAKERATTACEMFIIRHISTLDAVSCDFYHFDVEAFLRNIEVLQGGEVDAKALKKIEVIRDVVVDRTQYYVAKRKRGEDKLSMRDSKDIANNPIDLVLAIIYAMIDSGAIEYCGGGLAVKSFE